MNTQWPMRCGSVPSNSHRIHIMNQPSRRSFLRSTAALAALAAVGRPAQSLLGEVADAATPAPVSESFVRILFESLKPEQKKQICFPWDHVDPKRGLLRTRIENNWRITSPEVKSETSSYMTRGA